MTSKISIYETVNPGKSAKAPLAMLCGSCQACQHTQCLEVYQSQAHLLLLGLEQLGHLLLGEVFGARVVPGNSSPCCALLGCTIAQATSGSAHNSCQRLLAQLLSFIYWVLEHVPAWFLLNFMKPKACLRMSTNPVNCMLSSYNSHFQPLALGFIYNDTAAQTLPQSS